MRVLAIDVGKHNLALCVVDTDALAAGAPGIVAWTVADVREADCAHLLDALRALDRDGGLRADQVAVERQPPQNPSMCRLQHYIEAYFVMRGTPVYIQDAKHKLAFAAATRWWPHDDVSGWSYTIRKRAAVKTVRAYLEGAEGAEGWLRHFEAARKKDDLADSLLHALAYAHNNNLAPGLTARAAEPPNAPHAE